MQYGERIRRRRAALGMNQAVLAEKAGVSRNTVAGWETGHSRPDLDTLPALCTALQMSVNAFFGLEKEKTAEEREVLDLFFSLEERDRESLIWQMQGIREHRGAAVVRNAAAVQKAGRVPKGKPDSIPEEEMPVPLPKVVTLFRNDLGAAAGFGAPLGEAQGERVTLLAGRDTERADEIITVCGESMEPTFQDGDQVLVQHAREVRPGEIGIFLVDNEGYIKEYQKDGLHSHNPAFRTMTFREGQTVRCIGRVIGKLTEDMIPSRDQLNALNRAGEAEGD